MVPGNNPAAPAVSTGRVSTPFPWKRGSIFVYKCCPMILSTPKVGSALGIIAWCVMEELVHPSEAARRLCPSTSSKTA